MQNSVLTLLATRDDKKLDRLFRDQLKGAVQIYYSESFSDEWFKLLLSGILASYVTKKVENRLEESFSRALE